MAAEALRLIPSYMPWGHTNPTYSVRDDVGKSIGKHTSSLADSMCTPNGIRITTLLERLPASYTGFSLSVTCA